MKKLYFVILLFVSTLSVFAQGSEDFTNSTATASYADGSFVGNGGVTWNFGHSRNEDTYPIDGNGLMLRRSSDSYLEATISGGIGQFSFEYRKAFTGSTERQLEVIINGVSITTTSPFGTISGAETDIYTFSYAINQPGSVVVRIKNVGSTTTNRQTVIDNISWTAYSGTASPSLAITSPSNNDVYDPSTTSVDVNLSVLNFNVANGTGDGHIHYTVNNGSVVMKYDTDPINITVSQGNSYTVYAELVDNSHTPISPAVNATVTFSVSSFTVVNDLAALRADVITNGYGHYYQISSMPVISYSRSSRNQKYVQDATAGVLIDDNAAIMPYNDGTGTGPVQGDALAGLQGYTVNYNGVVEFVPITAATVNSSNNNITPQVVTAAEISANIEAYESELVQINNATFTTADGTIVFSTSTPGPNYNINDGSDLTFRAMFSEADYIGQVIPTTAQNLIVLVAEFNGTAQVVSRNMDDVNGVLSTKNFNTIDGLTMYPNPVSGNTLYINTTANAVKQVQVYNVLGKQVINTTVANNSLNVANLTSGVYIVKITEEGKTATRKLVVK